MGKTLRRNDRRNPPQKMQRLTERQKLVKFLDSLRWVEGKESAEGDKKPQYAELQSDTQENKKD
jgi:hypothetical protein